MRKLSVYLALAILAVAMVAPLAWAVLVSLHQPWSEIPEYGKLVPVQPRWDNYATVLFGTDLPVFRFALNSFFVCTVIVIGQVLVCSLGAYAFARLRFRGREALFALVLGSMMFGSTVTQIPVFLTMRQFGWLDTYLALVVPGLGSAFGVFLLRQAFLQVPRELDEAARLDGAGDWAIYSRIVMPMCKAAVATLAAFAFIGTWNDFFWPLIATTSLEMRTLEVGLSTFKNSYGGQNWPLQMAAAVIVVVPSLAVFLLCQKWFVRGAAVGSLK
ncbi:MAG: carbohydrate ABC transporter permease [Fimbriimonadaceae bacterium]|nr:carbohydrate ABC transporter permease [Fimbriimonadaceae bacterium]